MKRFAVIAALSIFAFTACNVLSKAETVTEYKLDKYYHTVCTENGPGGCTTRIIPDYNHPLSLKDYYATATLSVYKHDGKWSHMSMNVIITTTKKGATFFLRLEELYYAGARELKIQDKTFIETYHPRLNFELEETAGTVTLTRYERKGGKIHHHAYVFKK